MSGLTIKDVAQRTGIAAGTIRMWEQRYGFPEPDRTESGYRVYRDEDVDALRRVLAYRSRGLSVPAAIERAHGAAGVTDHPSIYAAVAASDPGVRPQVLCKRTLIALSRAIEHEAIAQAASPVLFGAFQHEAFYRSVESRWRRMAQWSDAAAVFADFGAATRPDGGPAELPVAPGDKLGNEWAVVVDAPGYAACLLAWEIPGDVEPGGPHDARRRFESIWTLDPTAVRRASEVCARLVGRADPTLGTEIEHLLADRPLALEEPVPGLTSLVNRVVAYLEQA